MSLAVTSKEAFLLDGFITYAPLRGEQKTRLVIKATGAFDTTVTVTQEETVTYQDNNGNIAKATENV